MELALAVVGAIWTLVVPGLPVAILLARRDGGWWEVAALSPMLSVGVNFALLQAQNRVGLAPNMRVYGLLLTLLTAVGTWYLLRRREGLGLPPPSILLALLPTVVGFLLWRAAFAGYALLAANADALNHNLWITRIAQGGSTLAVDVRVTSPLQERIPDASFYPLAWHAEVAAAAASFDVPPPTMSLVSTFSFWTVVLTLGLVAVARRLSDDGLLLGTTAALLAQTVPLVPGVPMTWGAMTSVVGIALLPAALLCVIAFFEGPGWSSTALLAVVVLTLFVAHSPEAATTVVLALVGVVVQAARGRLRRRLAVLLAALAVAALLVAVVVRGTLLTLYGQLGSLLGGNERTLNESIGSFLTLSVNVPREQLLFGVLVLAGLSLAGSTTRPPWLLVAAASTFGVYILSGANVEPLVQFRRLTAPWYGSYERTAWVAVPFLVLVAALPVVALLVKARERRPVTAFPLGLACILIAAQAWHGGIDNVRQLRKGVAENQVAGPGSRDLFARAVALAGETGVILSLPEDGSLYGYLYDGVPVTNGAFGRDGNPRPALEPVLAGLADLCGVPGAAAALDDARVEGVLVGTRQIASGPPRYTERELLELEGFAVVDTSTDLVLLRPDLEACP